MALAVRSGILFFSFATASTLYGQYLQQDIRISTSEVFADEISDVYYKQYTAADQQKKEFSTYIGLGERVYGSFVELINSVSHDQDVGNHLKGLQYRDNESAYLLNTSLLSHRTTVYTDQDQKVKQGVAHKLASSGSKHFSRKVTSQIEFIKKYRSGLNFKLDMGQLFSDEEPLKVSPRPLTYGLVLKDIEPAEHNLMQAAIGTFSPEELRYAGKAKASWSIEPMQQSGEHRVFHISEPTLRASQESRDATDDGVISHFGDWFSGVKSPRPSFGVSIVPGSVPDGTEPVEPSGMPDFKLLLKQDDDFYQMEYYSNDALPDLDKLQHRFTLPIYGSCSLDYRTDRSLALTKASLNGLLMISRAPSVNLHYLNRESRYKGDVSYAGDGYKVTFTADTPANGTADPIKKYEVGYSTLF